ncbi:MAG: hypothetical protein JWM91_4213 [Rhodospirillales bacterium]|nr:hypothetical protein [Rhodospirillales bacterium]
MSNGCRSGGVDIAEHPILTAAAKTRSGRSDGAALVAYVLAAAIGFVVAAIIFTPSVLLGTGHFWTAPDYPDMQQHLSAAQYYLHDSWRFPIFLTTLIMPPEGVSVVFLDVNPLLAFFAKLLFKATGIYVNHFGPWIALCYALQATAFLFLCRSLGLRGVVPTIVCAIIAVSVPEFLYRYFHLTLLGQFLITMQLGLYFRAVRDERYRAMSWWALGLTLLTILIHLYFFAMVAGIYAALLAHYAASGRQSLRIAILQLGMLAVGTWLLLFSTGYLHGLGGSSGFGYFSMNMLSPFVPQDSGVISGMHDMIDGTGGQYEGFNYLGIGILGLFALSLFLNRRDLWPLALRYRYLLILLLAFTGFALSFNPMVGDISLLHPFAHRPDAMAAGHAIAARPAAVASPAGNGANIHDLIFYPLQQFRASGRFFWPVGYCIAAFGIVGVWRRMPGMAGLAILAAAALLQFNDAGPLRHEMEAHIRAEMVPPAAPDPWVAMIAAHREITVLPSMDCAGSKSPLIPLFVFYASQNVIPTHSAKLSRGPKADCSAEYAGVAQRALGADEILVMLSPPLPAETIQAMPDSASLCRKFSLGYVCSRKWAELEAGGIKLTARDLRPPGPMPYNPAGESAGHRVRGK